MRIKLKAVYISITKLLRLGPNLGGGRHRGLPLRPNKTHIRRGGPPWPPQIESGSTMKWYDAGKIEPHLARVDALRAEGFVMQAMNR